jgi:hypothetical protein
MIMKKLAFATLVAMGMTAAAIAQQPGSQPGQQPGSSSTQPQTQPRNSQPPPQSQTPRQQQPSSQTSPAPRGGDRTEQVSFEKADKNSDGTVSRDEARDIDGFDFTVSDAARSLRFDMNVMSESARVEVGKDNVRPNGNPFTVELR